MELFKLSHQGNYMEFSELESHALRKMVVDYLVRHEESSIQKEGWEIVRKIGNYIHRFELSGYSEFVPEDEKI